MMPYAYHLSEELKVPVLMRVVTRLAHSRAGIVLNESLPQNQLNPDNERTHWVLLPGNARRQYASLVEKQSKMLEVAEASAYNALQGIQKAPMGIVACGIAYNYVMENEPHTMGYPVLKVSQYPLPEKAIRELAAHCESILVAEDGQPMVEEQLRGLLGAEFPLKGRLNGYLPRTGELTPDSVGEALGKQTNQPFAAAQYVAPRPPALCQCCGHRDVYTALNQVLAEYPNHRVFSDIGCYTLGALPPFQAIHSTVDMGASITMAKGAADAGLFPAVSVIGDSTFTHSGMTGLLDAVNSKAPITVVISDNLTTGMTGGQDSAGTGKLERICEAIGVEPEHIRVVVPLAKNMPEITEIIREELNYQGVSVIIPRRECIQTFARKAKQRKAAAKN
jgi:indolepyruvate ferredoxin oxidoreductase alpha subunit